MAQALTPFVQPAGPGQPAEAAWTLPRGGRGLRRWVVVAVVVAMLLGAVALLGPMIFRIDTEHGRLIIQTDDPNVEVLVKQGGRQVTILDVKSKQQIDLKAGEYEIELSGGAEGLRLSTNRFTLTRGGQKIVKVWREPNVGEVRIFERHDEAIRWVAFSPDGTQVISGSDDKTARLWDLRSGKLLHKLDLSDPLKHVAFSPDGAFVWPAELWSGGRGLLAVHLGRHPGGCVQRPATNCGTRVNSYPANRIQDADLG